MSATSLPEIREAEAPPAIAAIYAALNEETGIGQVNLIWRHAAALPGVLDWLWAQAAPALASGAAAAARDRITAAITLPASAPALPRHGSWKDWYPPAQSHPHHHHQAASRPPHIQRASPAQCRSNCGIAAQCRAPR